MSEDQLQRVLKRLDYTLDDRLPVIKNKPLALTVEHGDEYKLLGGEAFFLISPPTDTAVIPRLGIFSHHSSSKGNDGRVGGHYYC